MLNQAALASLLAMVPTSLAAPEVTAKLLSSSDCSVYPGYDPEANTAIEGFGSPHDSTVSFDIAASNSKRFVRQGSVIISPSSADAAKAPMEVRRRRRAEGGWAALQWDVGAGVAPQVFAPYGADDTRLDDGVFLGAHNGPVEWGPQVLGTYADVPGSSWPAF
ncbi:hypothetical protein F4780DRAFT_797272 [Xylariomycetidae sp. FL0641]|nr:hypothetical protein F4780DRAFT_797272 [Xylariomycetidae sp. FL0641]